MNSVYTDNRWGFEKVLTQNNYKRLSHGWGFGVFFSLSTHHLIIVYSAHSCNGWYTASNLSADPVFY